jgi:hypothetical protein
MRPIHWWSLMQGVCDQHGEVRRNAYTTDTLTASPILAEVQSPEEEDKYGLETSSWILSLLFWGYYSYAIFDRSSLILKHIQYTSIFARPYLTLFPLFISIILILMILPAALRHLHITERPLLFSTTSKAKGPSHSPHFLLCNPVHSCGHPSPAIYTLSRRCLDTSACVCPCGLDPKLEQCDFFTLTALRG